VVLRHLSNSFYYDDDAVILICKTVVLHFIIRKLYILLSQFQLSDLEQQQDTVLCDRIPPGDDPRFGLVSHATL
jgi:hypothetical protein